VKIVVFGASGRVGRLVVDAALKRGLLVTAFTRNSANIRVKHKNLRISGGNVSDDNAVREAMKGQQVAVVALGARDISRPHSVCSDGVKRIIAAAAMFNVPRIVMLGNLGLLPHASGKLQGEVNIAPFLQFIFADQKNAYTELRDSGLDYAVVCPPFMPQGTATGKYRVSVDATLEKAQQISVEDVAQALLLEVIDQPHHNVRVGVSY
jgi:putative NADH-flavin reductase